MGKLLKDGVWLVKMLASLITWLLYTKHLTTYVIRRKACMTGMLCAGIMESIDGYVMCNDSKGDAGAPLAS